MFIIGIIFLNGFGSNEVSAQSLKATRVEVKFDFRVGDKIYPAGIYTFESVSQSNENILRLGNGQKENSRLIITNLSYADKAQSPKLVFRQVGEDFYLTKIFLANGNWGFSVRPSRRQAENDKKLASTKFVEVSAKP